MAARGAEGVARTGGAAGDRVRALAPHADPFSGFVVQGGVAAFFRCTPWNRRLGSWVRNKTGSQEEQILPPSRSFSAVAAALSYPLVSSERRVAYPEAN